MPRVDSSGDEASGGELMNGMMVALAGALTTELMTGGGGEVMDLVGGVNHAHSITPTRNILSSWWRINRQVPSLGLVAD